MARLFHHRRRRCCVCCCCVLLSNSSSSRPALRLFCKLIKEHASEWRRPRVLLFIIQPWHSSWCSQWSMFIGVVACARGNLQRPQSSERLNSAACPSFFFFFSYKIIYTHNYGCISPPRTLTHSLISLYLIITRLQNSISSLNQTARVSKLWHTKFESC